MTEAPSKVTDEYAKVKPVYSTVLKDSLALLNGLKQLPPESRDIIKKHAATFPHQDMGPTQDPANTLPGYLSSLASLDSALSEAGLGEKRPLTREEKEATHMPWHTVAEFRGEILAVRGGLKEALAHEKSLDSQKTWDLNTLKTPPNSPKYEQLAELTELAGRIANESWALQVFIQPRIEKVHEARQQHEQAQPVIGNATGQSIAPKTPDLPSY